MNEHLTDQQLIDYQFDLACEADAKEARAHLEKCDACRRRLHELGRKLNALDLIRDDVKASRTLLSQTIHNAQKAGRWRRLLLHRLPWAGAVAAAVVVGIGLLAIPDRGSKSVRDLSTNAQVHQEMRAAKDTAEEVPMLAMAPSPTGSVMIESLRGEGVPPLHPDGILPSEDEAGRYALAMQDKGRMPSPLGDRSQAAFDAAVQAATAQPDRAIDDQPPFAPASAIELVVLPRRENVQLTIYNAADLTLVREKRNLTLKRGWNWLQFMWANTLIDPTSLSLEPLEHKGEVQVQQLVFPPRLKDLGRWLIRSEIDGQVPFELTYFTSGLAWRAFYMGTLSQDEKTLRLEGYVRVSNNSGEDYEDAQARLIVGRIHLLDQIAELARRQHPYGSPSTVRTLFELNTALEDKGLQVEHTYGFGGRFDESLRRKDVQKEGLSEYFLYTIEGTETIPNQWGKRLMSFQVDDIPVASLCKYDEERWGDGTIRFLTFANDKEHKLGETPLPDGMVRVYGRADGQGHLSYVGGMDVKYIPVGGQVELELDPARLVEVKPSLMDYRTANHEFDAKGDVNGWEEVRSWKVEIVNARTLPVQIDVTRGFETPYWTLKLTGGSPTYRKHDATHARFELTVPPRQTQVFEYEVTTYHGVREQSFVNKELN
ncbi:MAG TPA: hypothetical protein PKZ07_16610 [Sedimentisphaerales bacterium]|nr:hypothetical protein [Sedimentisphaerales bacterium]